MFTLMTTQNTKNDRILRAAAGIPLVRDYAVSKPTRHDNKNVLVDMFCSFLICIIVTGTVVLDSQQLELQGKLTNILRLLSFTIIFQSRDELNHEQQLL
jgi:hypothetical protein